MKNFKLSLLVLGALVVAGCSEKTTIKGMVENAPSSEIVAKVLNVNVYDILDTLKTSSDGSFKFSAHIEAGQPEFIYLFYKDTKIASLLVSKGEKPYVKADTLGRFSVDGSPESEKLKAVENAYSEFMTNFTAAQADKKKLTDIYISYYRDRVKYVIENKSSLTCVPVLFQKITTYNPVFSQYTDALQFRSVCDTLKQLYPDSKYVKALEKETLDREKTLEFYTRIQSTKPSDFPEILLPDIKGVKRALSEVESKAILLHFWDASNPAQKMLNIEALLPLYEKYSSKGFEIYSVCLSLDKVEWATTVRNQNLPWINVFDGMGEASRSAAVYGIGELPNSILIADGQIKVPTIEGGKGLEIELSKLLK